MKIQVDTSSVGKMGLPYNVEILVLWSRPKNDYMLMKMNGPAAGG